MTFRFDGYNWLVRLERGELLVQMLTELIKTEDIKGAWISGIGGAQWAELGFYDLKAKKYHWQKLDMGLEITGLQGNVAWQDGQPALHLHGSFSDAGMRGYGGHVRELEVAGTCEILLHRWYQPEGLTRSKDETIGLNLLQL